MARQLTRNNHWQRMEPYATADGAARTGGVDLSLPFLLSQVMVFTVTRKTKPTQHNKHYTQTMFWADLFLDLLDSGGCQR